MILELSVYNFQLEQKQCLKGWRSLFKSKRAVLSSICLSLTLCLQRKHKS